MSDSLGNQVNKVINQARAQMFRQAELAQLTYLAFGLAAREVTSPEAPDSHTIIFPIGMRPDQTAMPGERVYSRQDLQNQYQYLAVHQLSINCIYQLVSIVESMIDDVLRAVLKRYPAKLGSKKKIGMELVLECSSIEEVHDRAIDNLLNELSYESPHEHAESLKQYLSVNALECPAFHKYLEVKATRDIYVHGRGLSNKTYLRKCGTHARVSRTGIELPADTTYFLSSYEACLQLSEWLEEELHKCWESTDLLTRRTQQMEMPLASPPEEISKKPAKKARNKKPK